MADSNFNQPGLGTNDTIGVGGLMSAHTAWTKSWQQLDDNSNPQGDESKPRQEQNAPEEVKISIELIESLESKDPGIYGDYSPNILVTNLPLVGRIHLLRHWVGFLTVGFIVLYWIYGIWSTIYVILKPHYDDGEMSGLPILWYSVISILCISALFKAVTSNPGRIPFSQEPAVPPEELTANHCEICRRRRPQRSHHCRRCGQCILRMDHHCPWINNCVGQENHWVFMQLLWYAFLMSSSTFIFCLLHIYYWPPCQTCDKASLQYGVAGELVFSLSVGMALGMMGGSGILLIVQLTSIITDMTTIDWMKLQNYLMKRGKPDISDIPAMKKTCLQGHDDLCGGGSRLLWPFPCRRRQGPLYVTYPQIV